MSDSDSDSENKPIDALPDDDSFIAGDEDESDYEPDSYEESAEESDDDDPDYDPDEDLEAAIAQLRAEVIAQRALIRSYEHELKTLREL
jgi:hypothetical protein